MARGIGCLLGLLSGSVFANGVVFFDDRDAFVAATGGILVTVPYVEGNFGGASQDSGSIRFDPVLGSGLFFSDWPADFPGDNDVELAINGDENLDIVHTPGQIFAMGFDFDIGASNPGPSEFTVAAMRGSLEVARLIFQDTSLPDGRFVGIWSPIAFDRLEVREREPVNGNEYFGSVFVGITPPPPQPGTPLIDAFEWDGNELSAVDMSNDVIASEPDDMALGDNITLSQAHSVHVSSDEDWLFVPMGSNGDQVEVLVEDPRTRVTVEAYGVDRLTSNVAPLLTLGDCGSAGIDAVADFNGTRLLRVLACPGTVPGYYQIRYTYFKSGAGSFDQTFSLSGQVVEAGSGAPVGVFILASTGGVVVSSPETGNYVMLLLRNRLHTISVVSPDFETATFDVMSLSQNIQRDITVGVSAVFVDSFE